MICTLPGEDAAPDVPENFDFDQLVTSGVLILVAGQTIRADGRRALVVADCPVGRLSGGMFRVARRPMERVIS
jgi:hypothetical protein